MTIWSRIRDMFGAEMPEAVASTTGVDATASDLDPLSVEPVTVVDAAAVAS
jgi:hypothetical protein